MTQTNRLGTLSVKKDFVKRVATVVFAVAFGLVAQSAPAMAATSVIQKGTPGLVFESNPPATCVPYDTFMYPNSSGVKTTVYAPTVLAAALSNGSQTQYVHYYAALVDTKTGTGTGTGWSPWALATAQTPAQWPAGWVSPSMIASYDPYTSGPFVVIILVEWWDPVSRLYTGSLQYTVNKYMRSSGPSTYYFTLTC